ncbi:MAG: LLM class flavin-dependent oxidoreductase [Nocardioidaceae bacterium]
MTMKFGVDITSAGPWGDPEQMAELAVLAEASGWNGVFCEDYVVFPDGAPTYDPWVSLGLMAQATTTVTLGTMVTPLPRRRPSTVAAQAMTVDRVSGGRLVLGVGLGDGGDDFAGFGETADLRERAEILDESLSILDALWSGEPCTFHGRHFDVSEVALAPTPVQRPRVPIWVGGALTKRGPRARALRWDGACMYRVPPSEGWGDVTPEDVRQLRADARDARGDDLFVVAVGGRERGDDLAAEQAYVAALGAAGADWWHEYMPPTLEIDHVRERIGAGPLRGSD